MGPCDFKPMLTVHADGTVEGDYWERIHELEGQRGADYIRRHEQLEKEEYVRAERTINKKSAPKKRKSKLQSKNDIRTLLYLQGKTDGEIAQQCGCKRETIEGWRKFHGLEANQSVKKQLHRRMELYKQGLTDKQLAQKCKVSLDAIKAWRKKHGLKGNIPADSCSTGGSK